MSKASDLIIESSPELQGRLVESRRELLNLRFQLATGQLDKTSQLHAVRCEVARLMTILREREIAHSEGPAPRVQDEPDIRDDEPGES